MEILEGLLELPGAIFRKLVTATEKSFEEVLKDHTKNKLAGLCVLIIILTLIFVLIVTS
jgi:Fe2+ transport system protein B